MNLAREAFHAHLASKKASSLQPDYTDEELLMEDTSEFDREYSGQIICQNMLNKLASVHLAI